MTIEQTLDSINTGIQQLVAGQQQLLVALLAPPSHNAQVPQAPAQVPQAPVQAAAPIPQQQPAYQPAPQNPAPPSPSVPAGAAPFVDAKGLMDYAMQKYQQLGPVKGGMIQTVLMGMNCPNINMLQPAQYAEFYSKVESIR